MALVDDSSHCADSTPHAVWPPAGSDDQRSGMAAGSAAGCRSDVQAWERGPPVRSPGGPALERDRRRRKRGALELVGRGRREQGTKPLMILEGQREGLLRRPVPPRVGAPPAFLLRKRQVVQLEVGACEVGDRAGRPVPGAPRLRDMDPTIADVARADLRRRGGVAARTAAALRSPGLPVSHRHDSVGPPADPTKRPARTRCTGDGRLNPHATPATPSPSRSHGTRRYRPLR